MGDNPGRVPYHGCLHGGCTTGRSFMRSIVNAGPQYYRSWHHVFVGFVIFAIFLCRQWQGHEPSHCIGLMNTCELDMHE